MSELFLLFNRESRQGGQSARGILFYDPVSMIETSDLAPSSEDLLSEKETLKTEGNSFHRPRSLIGQRQVSHMCSWLMSLPHVGPICLPTLWKHVSVSEAGVMSHA